MHMHHNNKLDLYIRHKFIEPSSSNKLSRSKNWWKIKPNIVTEITFKGQGKWFNFRRFYIQMNLAFWKDDAY